MLGLVPQIYVYDVKELIELPIENPGIEVEHEAHEKVKQLTGTTLEKVQKNCFATHLLIFYFMFRNLETYNAQKLNKDIR